MSLLKIRHAWSWHFTSRLDSCTPPPPKPYLPRCCLNTPCSSTHLIQNRLLIKGISSSVPCLPNAVSSLRHLVEENGCWVNRFTFLNNYDVDDYDEIVVAAAELHIENVRDRAIVVKWVTCWTRLQGGLIASYYGSCIVWILFRFQIQCSQRQFCIPSSPLNWVNRDNNSVMVVGLNQVPALWNVLSTTIWGKLGGDNKDSGNRFEGWSSQTSEFYFIVSLLYWAIFCSVPEQHMEAPSDSIFSSVAALYNTLHSISQESRSGHSLQAVPHGPLVTSSLLLPSAPLLSVQMSALLLK